MAMPLAATAQVYDMQGSAYVRAQQAEALLQTHQYEQAIAIFKIALQLDPYSPLAATIYNNLAVAYRQTRNFPMAISAMQRAIRMNPGFLRTYDNLIETYRQAGHLPLALERLNAMVIQNPQNAEAWCLLGIAYTEAGNPRIAHAAFTRFLKKSPQSRLAAPIRKRLSDLADFR